MELDRKVAINTGGAGGVGHVMPRAVLTEGAGAMVLCDLDSAQVGTTAGLLTFLPSLSGQRQIGQSSLYHWPLRFTGGAK